MIDHKPDGQTVIVTACWHMGHFDKRPMKDARGAAVAIDGAVAFPFGDRLDVLADWLTSPSTHPLLR